MSKRPHAGEWWSRLLGIGRNAHRAGGWSLAAYASALGLKMHAGQLGQWPTHPASRWRCLRSNVAVPAA
jgi:hypothetical protein